MAAGIVLSLHRWPVKSLGGEDAGALRVDPRGVGGDRAHALEGVVGGRRRPLTVREVPRMLAWRAAYPMAPDEALDPADPPAPVLTAPDGRAYAWTDPALPGALRDDLGRPVTLRRDLALMPDVGDTLLVTVEATRAAVEAALERPLERRRFRPNVHVALDAPPFAEEDWPGRRLRVGAAELVLLQPCERCVIPTRDPRTQERWPQLLRWLARERGGRFGVYGRPVAPATIRVGDPVELV